jgi:CheY-like chemotaxis protein
MGAEAIRASVLVVDDDADIRETISLVLQDEGYGVACVANGAEALVYLRSHPHPSLILLDLMMPVMDGIEFRAEQRRDPELAPIPVVVISASGNMREKSSQLAAAALIQKPIALDTLLDVVARCSSVPMDATM